MLWKVGGAETLFGREKNHRFCGKKGFSWRKERERERESMLASRAQGITQEKHFSKIIGVKNERADNCKFLQATKLKV